MKKLYIYVLCAFFALMSNNLYAIKAYPETLTVTQPNGTTITIKVHGDEFLNYITTTSGQLIKAGADGYYYYASFRGTSIVTSSQRVGSGTSSLFTRGGSVFIPEEAIAQAQQKRQEWARNMANAPKFEIVKTRASEMASLVLLVQTSDVKFKTPNATVEFNNMLNQIGYSKNGGTGSVKEYYYDNSMGNCNFNFITSTIITLPNTMLYYADNMREMIVEACKLAKSSGINFAQFDNNNDGVVDNVYVFFAGYDKAQGGVNTIWSHAGGISDPTLFDGKKLSKYACSSELMGNSGSNMVGIGTFTHEFAHVLGTSDLYDTDYEKNGQTKGLYGRLALMDGGGYNNGMKTPPYLTAIERQMLGWIEPQKISTAANYTIDGIEKNKAYVIESDNKGEYFIIEHRNNNKWDKYIGGTGLLIYQVDKSNNIVSGSLMAYDTWTVFNNINNYVVHPCARVITPTDKDMQDIKDIFYLTQPSKVLTQWSSRKLPQSLHNITNGGSKTTFSIKLETKSTLRGIITDTEKQPLVGAKMIIQKKSSTKTSNTISSKGLSVAPVFDIKTKTVGKEIVTDGNGQFSIGELENGPYVYLIKHEGYASFTGEIEVSNGDNLINVSLQTIVQNNTSYLSWANPSIASAVGGINSDIYGANYWNASDLKEHQNSNIKSISFITYNINSFNVTIGIKVDNVDIFTKELGTNYSQGANVIDISSASLTIPKDKSVMVWIKYADTKSNHVLGVDKGPALVGYGDLFSTDGKTWSSLKGKGIDYNVILGITVVKDDTESKIQKVVLQRNVWLDFTKLNPSSKAAKIELLKVGDTNPKKIDCGSVQNFMITGLIPENGYNFKLYVDNSLVATSSFLTNKLSSEYTMIYESKNNYAAGDKIILDVLNLPDDIKSVKWFVNGNEYKSNTLILTADSEIKVELMYSQGDIEVITRKIKIKR